MMPLRYSSVLTNIILITVLPEVESRTQGSRSRPKTQKNLRPRTALLRTDPLSAWDRNARSQGNRRKCSPKKSLQKNISGDFKKKKVFKIMFFRRFPKEGNKIGLRKFSVRFLAFSHKILTVQKIVLSSSRGQGNFRGLEASRPRT